METPGTIHTKRKRGRPRFEPDEEQRKAVYEMAGLRRPVSEIAKVIGKQETTIRKHFARELAAAEATFTASLVQAMYEIAIGKGPGSVAAANFVAEVWGLKAPAQIEHTGKDGGPIAVEKEIRIVFVKPPVYPDDPPLIEGVAA